MTWFNDPQKNRAFERGETCKVRWEVIPYTQGTGLDIGCGKEKLWSSSIGVDSAGREANLAGDVRRLRLIADGCMDYVYSSHCLEDLEDTPAALAEWWRVLRVGGHLVLYLPHADLYPRRGKPGANPAHKHDFLPEDIVRAMQAAAPDWALVENQVRGDGDEYSFLQVYRKRAAGKGQGAALEEADPAKRCIVMRYGGYGDVLIGASTFPHLKAQGWHLTVYTGEKGAEVLKHDPHVDRVVSHDVVGWSNGDLRSLARYLRQRCAKFVSFSETFEGLLLADPRRANFWWSHEMRQRYMNGSYLEAAHTAAGVPQEYRQKFYATPEELEHAEGWRAGMPRLVVIAASGSGVNKFWPGVFEYAWRLANLPGVHVAVVGDLQGGSFVEHERLHVLGTSWSVRKTLALAQAADLVIGQETGVLNAVAMEPMPKIVLLSHSSPENLTSHWQNTATLAGAVACHPCHRLHANWEGCSKDPETKLAACQAAIPPARALELTKQLLGVMSIESRADAAEVVRLIERLPA